MQWKILQQNKPKDYVVATGKAYSVKEFINICCKYLGLKIVWEGKGLDTRAYLIKGKKKELLIKVDKKYFRPADIDYLKGDSRKALKDLKFKFKYNIYDLVKEMLDSDIEKAKKL